MTLELIAPLSDNLTIKLSAEADLLSDRTRRMLRRARFCFTTPRDMIDTGICPSRYCNSCLTWLI